MNTLPPSLLRRRPLLPGESLPSLLMRLAKVNHYNPPSVVMGLALAQNSSNGGYRDISRSLSLTILERLAALTKIDLQALYSSTYHRFAPTITPPDKSISYLELTNKTTMPLLAGGVAQVQMRPEFAVQFCPECLKSSTYHRLIWVPIAVAACLDHKCLLNNCCPQCGKSINTRDIIETYCSRCKRSLIEARSIQVQHDEFGLFSQYVIQSWFEDGEVSNSSKHFLSEQPINALYRLIDGLRMALMQKKSDWSYLHRLSIEMQPTSSWATSRSQVLTPYQSYSLYATAMKALVNWPEGFYAFLDAFSMHLTKGKQSGYTVAHDLGILYHWLEKYWQNPIFTFVQEAFNRYFVNNYSLKHEVVKLSRYRSDRELVKRFTYITLSEVVDILHADAVTIKFLVKIGQLTKYESQDVRKYLLFDRSEVLALQARWLDTINLDATAALMGITIKGIPSMVKLGLLEAELSPLDGVHCWKIKKSSVTGLMKKLAERCNEMGDNTSKVKSFTSASHLYVLKSGLESAHLLLQVTMGSIRIYHKKDHPIQVRSLFFDLSDMNACLTKIFAENGWVDTLEAIRLLKTSPKNLSRWVKEGLLVMSQYKITNVFEMKSIEEFLINLVRTKAASEILGVEENDINRLAHQGYLKAVSGPTIDGYGFLLFRRDTLLEWKNNWLTSDEAAKLLQVEKGILFNLVKSGLLVTLESSYGVKILKGRSWYSRQSVLELQKEMCTKKA